MVRVLVERGKLVEAILKGNSREEREMIQGWTEDLGGLSFFFFYPVILKLYRLVLGLHTPLEYHWVSSVEFLYGE